MSIYTNTNARSFDVCALKCLFLGYAFHQKGYRCFDPQSKRTYVTMDVTFMESEMFFPPNSALQRETIYHEGPNWLALDWPGQDDSPGQENSPRPDSTGQENSLRQDDLTG